VSFIYILSISFGISSSFFYLAETVDEKRGVDLMKYNELGPYEFFQLSQINFKEPFYMYIQEE